MDESLVFLKPDAVLRRSIGAAILQEFLENSDKFTIVAFKEVQVSVALAKKHYQEHEGKSFFPWLVKSVQAAPVIAMIVRGSVQQIRSFLGATFVQKAEPNTVRGKYGVWGGVNSVHASDSPESAKCELELWNDLVHLEKDPSAVDKIKAYIAKWIKDLNPDNTKKLREICRRIADNQITKEEALQALIQILKNECPLANTQNLQNFARIVVENILL